MLRVPKGWVPQMNDNQGASILIIIFVLEQIDPCKDKQCGFGSRCVPSPDGRTASCVCPDKCPSYGDHAESRPVCGSDGVDYNDLCGLNRAACLSNANITQKFSGKCGRWSMKSLASTFTVPIKQFSLCDKLSAHLSQVKL